MPHRTSLAAKARIAGVEMFIEIWKLNRERLFEDVPNGGSDPPGAVVIGMTVLLGDLQRKPMNASKIAAYLDLPRSTVRDKLGQLEAWKVVMRNGNNYVVAPKRIPMSAERVEQYNKVVSKFVTAWLAAFPQVAKSATKTLSLHLPAGYSALAPKWKGRRT